MFVKIENGVITERKVRLGGGQREVGTGNWVMPHDSVWSDEDALRCGWHRVAETEEPAYDFDTETLDSSIELVDGSPVQVWTVGPVDTEIRAQHRRRTERRDLRTAPLLLRAADPEQTMSAAQTRGALRVMARWILQQDPE